MSEGHRRRLAAVTVSLITGCSVCATADASATLRLSQLGLGPVHIGDTFAQAQSSSGFAISTQAGVNGCAEWTLPGVISGTQLTALHGRLGLIAVYRRGTATTRGVRVGDSLARLRSHYRHRLRSGKSASLGAADQRLFSDRVSRGVVYTLEFDIYAGKVGYITAATRHTIETFGECG